MHIWNDPSFFLTNRTGAPHGDELGLMKPLSESSCSCIRNSFISNGAIDNRLPGLLNAAPVLLEVARGPTLKASDGVGICPLGSLVIVVAVVVVIVVVAVVVVIVVTVVVVVICSCMPAPTVPG
ncbi:hypothetical protein Tco_1362052 [Tanacetum coccineum]